MPSPRPVTALAVALLAAARGAPVPFDGVVRDNGDGTASALLAPPHGGNHAAFIEALPDGTIAVAWFTGGEGSPNCSIALSLLWPGSTTFTPGRVVSLRSNFSNQNPVLFYDHAADTLNLFHSSQVTGGCGNVSCETTSTLWRLTSADAGASWSPAALFWSAPGAFDRNRIVPLRDGGVAFPCYNSSPGPDSSFVLLADAGRTAWAPVQLPQSWDLIQPSVVRLPPPDDGVLRAFLRDEDAVAVYAADSTDEGRSWSLPRRTALPNNNAGIEAAVLASGALVMALNPISGTGQPRAPLALALSRDGGATWPAARVLQAHDDNSSAVGEYSYPSLLQTRDGAIHVVYTYDRATIKYVRLANESLIAGGARVALRPGA